MTEVRRFYRELVARVRDGEAHTPRALRESAFANAGLDEPTRTLVDKVAQRSYAVTDEDVAAVRASMSEDQIFELVVCAAVGAAGRQYDTALAALAEATKAGR
jgi:hypothetical protein